MTPEPTSRVARHVRRVAAALAPDPEADGALLARFLAGRDEDAFAQLVRRHGPMVLGVCRRVTGNSADADDAFQAAFVVLVRRAAGLTSRATVGDWLYGVAYHTALKANAMAARRRTKEATAARPEAAPEPADPADQAALDRALAALPAKYREPVVLCELEGRPRKEVADRLGIPEGTLSSRLATARKRLAARLRDHGFAGVAVGVSPDLLNSTLRAAAVAAGHAAGTVSITVTTLAAEVARTMYLTKLRTGVAVVAAALLGSAAGVTTLSRLTAETPVPAHTAATTDGPTAKELVEKRLAVSKLLDGTWEWRKIEVDGEEKELPTVFTRLTFSGVQDLKIEHKEKDGTDFVAEMTYSVNPTADPPQMTHYGKGRLVMGIYELDGDTLKFAYHGISELERPRGFAVKDKRIADLPLIVNTFTRVKPEKPQPPQLPQPAQTATAPPPRAVQRESIGPPTPGEPAWKAEFRKVYSLADGQVVKLVPPPFSACRADFFAEIFQSEKPPEMVHLSLTDDGRRLDYRSAILRRVSSGANDKFAQIEGMDLPLMLEQVFGIPRQEIEGDASLLKERVDADFVVRTGSTPERLMAGLEAELRAKYRIPVRLTFREVEREVVIARGKFAAKPRAGREVNHIDLYSDRFLPDGPPVPEVPFSLVMNVLSRVIDRRVINEAEGLSDGTFVTFRNHIGLRPNPRPDIERVLRNVAAQTGLTFTTETRKVRVLFVEKAEK